MGERNRLVLKKIQPYTYFINFFQDKSRKANLVVTTCLPKIPPVTIPFSGYEFKELGEWCEQWHHIVLSQSKSDGMSLVIDGIQIQDRLSLNYPRTPKVRPTFCVLGDCRRSPCDEVKYNECSSPHMFSGRIGRISFCEVNLIVIFLPSFSHFSKQWDLSTAQSAFKKGSRSSGSSISKEFFFLDPGSEKYVGFFGNESFISFSFSQILLQGKRETKDNFLPSLTQKGKLLFLFSHSMNIIKR